jgi:hypothetical protein
MLVIGRRDVMDTSTMRTSRVPSVAHSEFVSRDLGRLWLDLVFQAASIPRNKIIHRDGQRDQGGCGLRPPAHLVVRGIATHK